MAMGGGDADGMPNGAPGIATPTEGPFPEDLRFQELDHSHEREHRPDQEEPNEATEAVGHDCQGGDTNDFFNEVNDDSEDVPMRELMKMFDNGTRAEVRETNDEILSFIRDFGGNEVKYRRERGKALRAIVRRASRLCAGLDYSRSRR